MQSGLSQLLGQSPSKSGLFQKHVPYTQERHAQHAHCFYTVAWSVPQPEWASPNACPPPGLGKGQAYIVGRTMFETDRLSAERQRRCNAMDEVWVPTEFHHKIFVKSGVEASK